MLEEFLKQDKMLQQKCMMKKEQIGVMNKLYEIESKKIKEQYYYNKEM